MRPTWYAATIVEPFEKLSGSTFAWWFVEADPWQVACVYGSEPITRAVAALAGETTDRAIAMAAMTAARPRVAWMRWVENMFPLQRWQPLAEQGRQAWTRSVCAVRTGRQSGNPRRWSAGSARREAIVDGRRVARLWVALALDHVARGR